MRNDLSKNVSALLDFFRYLAALLVVFHHLEHLYPKSWISPLASFGHDAVIFFFILSGFVIAHTTRSKDFGWRAYAISRLSRIYSVVLPALALTILLYSIGRWLGLARYSGVSSREWLDLFPVSLAFLNYAVGMQLEVPTNTAYWSICFEVWYYLIFGCVFYFSGIWRLLLLIVVVLSAGAGTLLMFPIWVLGYWFYGRHAKVAMSAPSAVLLTATAVFFYLFMRWSNLDDQIFNSYSQWFGGANHLNYLLGFGKRFLVDYLIALLMLAMLCGVFSIANARKEFSPKIVLLVQQAAGGSFSMYLFHMPLLTFISIYSRSSVFTLTLTLVLCDVFSRWTERKKSLYMRALYLLFRMPSK